MMKRISAKRFRAGLAAAVLAAGAILMAPATASADGPCGTSYQYRASWPMYHKTTGARVGQLAVYYSSSFNRACAVAFAQRDDIGANRWREIWIWRNDQALPNVPASQHDAGTYNQYAGPVYVPLNGECVNVDASFRISKTASPYAFRTVGDLFC